MKRLVPLLLVISLAACSQKQEAACNGEDAKSLVASIIKDGLVKQVTSDFASQDAHTNFNVDSALIRATVDKVVITIEDVLTTKSDPNSTKKFCEGKLKLAVPTEVVQDADAVRSMLSLKNSHQDAMQEGVDFDANALKSSLDYDVQPTDDGKKIYAATDGKSLAVKFASTLIEQSLLKTTLEKRKADQTQQEQQKAMQEQQKNIEIAQAQAAEGQAALQKAQADIKAANDALNVVWNAGSKEWRQELLPEQRLWLAQRENGCKIKALDSGSADSVAFQTSRLQCEVQMTVERTQALKASLQKNLSQQSTSQAPAPNAALVGTPALTTSFDCSKARSDAERLICSDPVLASNDVELAKIFVRAKAAAIDQTAFRERVRQQWNYREQNCHDRECLVRWYADQKTVLTQISQTGKVN
ncbi:hypothetical protein TK49_13010 [Ralstonia mannitolilytica]|uniref:lysozyme inhibitor LprI family protein n=1 Tax=Ralstonia mannitolilytica TaxID=105219 RepID=UPI0005D77F5F|nr:lysozyme inhibitor LprI family protein [Ralstonia mannitolilytica]AJW45538.1 hypothetical protein TK49_13010 [Ralstonia mannitolilytica]